MRFWKHIGEYDYQGLPKDSGTWMTDAIPIDGMAGACIMRDSSGKNTPILLVNGQAFIVGEEI